MAPGRRREPQPTLFLVDYDTPGVTMKHDPDYTHTFADRHPQFVLEDVRVPASAILGGLGRADELTNEWFVEERIHIGARCAGAMERLLALAVDWATSRVQFGAADLRLPGRVVPARRLGRGRLGRPPADPRGGRARRRRRRPEGRPRQGVARQALRVGGGVALRRPGRPGLRRPRLHARVPGRALPPRAPRRPDLGGHVGDPADDRRPGAREARRRRGWSGDARRRSRSTADRGAAAPATATGRRPTARRSTSARSSRRARSRSSARRPAAGSPRRSGTTSGSWTARPAATSSTRATTSSTASPATRRSPTCPRSPTPSSSRSTRSARRRSSPTRPPPACRAVIIPGGGVVEGGAAAAAMQREVRDARDPPRDRAPRPELHGPRRPDDERATYIGDVNPWLPRGGVAGIAQSGLGDRRVHPLRQPDRLLADRRLRQRGRPRRLRLPRPRDRRRRRPRP